MGRYDLHALLLDLAADEADVDAERRAAVERALPWVEFLAVVREGGPGGWRRDAACRGLSHLFFVSKGQSTQPARDLCGVCTVREQCEEWVSGSGSHEVGFIAGTTERERAAARAAAKRDAA